MMLGNPTVQIPPWDPVDDQMASPFSPTNLSSVNFSGNAGAGDYYSPLLDLHRYLPSNEEDSMAEESNILDAFSCDHFRMYEFKVRKCARARPHDWTECPFAHPGEKARRRDPRKYHYSGTACTDFRKGSCRKGDACEFAHGVFECWLHPARYRTQPCKDGPGCLRQVCFFAHTPDQLRIIPPQHCQSQSPRSHGSGDTFDGSPSIRHGGFDPYFTKGSFVSSPNSILTSPPGSSPSDSPPMSPNGGQLGVNSVGELMRTLQLGKMKISSSRGVQMGSVFGSPRGSTLRPGSELCSLPSTPTRAPTRSGLGPLDLWTFEEEPAMERVESGRDIRAKMYAKLSKENSLGRVDSAASTPDVGWVSELVK